MALARRAPAMVTFVCMRLARVAIAATARRRACGRAAARVI
jgi:hypothetical protein